MTRPIKQVEIKVFATDYKSSEKYIFNAEAGTHFTPEGIDVILKDFKKMFDGQFPGNQMTFVPVAANKFNLVQNVARA